MVVTDHDPDGPRGDMAETLEHLKGPRSWATFTDVAPLTHNEERRLNIHARAQLMRMWRQFGSVKAKQARIPHLAMCHVTFRAHQLKGRLQDPMASAPAVKGFVDGLVDAGVLDDDDGTHVLSITALPAVRGMSGLEVTVTEAPRGQPAATPPPYKPVKELVGYMEKRQKHGQP